MCNSARDLHTLPDPRCSLTRHTRCISGRIGSVPLQAAVCSAPRGAESVHAAETMRAILHHARFRGPAFAAVVGCALLVGGRSIGDLQAQGTVTVTGYAPSHSAAKVFYRPVPGAKDYRIYDISDPNNVKYAGLVHLTPDTKCPGQYCDKHFVLSSDGVTPVFPYQIAAGATGGPQSLDLAATQIDWNGLGDGASHTLIVEA